MAGKIQLSHSRTAKDVYAIVRSSLATVWQTTTSTLVAYVTANRANYLITCNEQGTASMHYVGDFPAAPAGDYVVTFFEKVGGSRAETDSVVGVGAYTWDGTSLVCVSDKTGFSLAATGLDAIPTTAPTGVATTFREMVVQTWRRFFKKATKDSVSLKTYEDDNTTVKTSQTISVSGGTETQGPAS